ncbi:MAG: chorismate mutase [Bryobacterales bacterium]|jgi:chorismate mutase|nr:chorismate mutase [Bryobacterales bacterium]
MTEAEAREALARLRVEIDAVDLRLLELLNDRTRIVERIGSIKQAVSLPIYEPNRENDVFRNVMDNNPGPLPSEAVKRVFERIIDEMRVVQRLRMEKKD